jgi:predicted transcriptional regulator
MRLLNLSLPDDYRERLDELSRSTGLARSDHIRRALDDYFAKLQATLPEKKGKNSGHRNVRHA